MSTSEFYFLEERLFRGVAQGVAEGLHSVRQHEHDRLTRPNQPVSRMLTTEMVVEWALRGDQAVMNAALPYLQQGMYHKAAFDLVCHHLVAGSETDYFCTNHLLRAFQSDCDKWEAMMPNLRQTTALYSVAKFILAECEEQAPA